MAKHSTFNYNYVRMHTAKLKTPKILDSELHLSR